MISETIALETLEAASIEIIKPNESLSAQAQTECGCDGHCGCDGGDSQCPGGDCTYGG
jgi:hypothetical protein